MHTTLESRFHSSVCFAYLGHALLICPGKPWHAQLWTGGHLIVSGKCMRLNFKHTFSFIFEKSFGHLLIRPSDPRPKRDGGQARLNSDGIV
jgi:hypothetical protein